MWRKENPDVRANFSWTQFNRADLSGVNLSSAHLNGQSSACRTFIGRTSARLTSQARTSAERCPDFGKIRSLTQKDFDDCGTTWLT